MLLIEYYNVINDGQKAESRKQAFVLDDIGLELEHFEELYEKKKRNTGSKTLCAAWVRQRFNTWNGEKTICDRMNRPDLQ